jgi:hypothetical protein
MTLQPVVKQIQRSLFNGHCAKFRCEYLLAVNVVEVEVLSHRTVRGEASLRTWVTREINKSSEEMNR